MSFFHTIIQIRAGTKTETTRKGWEFLKPGDIVMACAKCQGLKKGEKIRRIRMIRIKKIEKIRNDIEYYKTENVKAEGFHRMEPYEFCYFILYRKCGIKIYEEVNRITFEYV